MSKTGRQRPGEARLAGHSEESAGGWADLFLKDNAGCPVGNRL